MIVNEKHQGLRYGNSSYSDREIFSVFMVCVHGVHLKKKKTLLDESDVYQQVFRCAKLYTIKSSLHYRQTPTSVIISLITSSWKKQKQKKSTSSIKVVHSSARFFETCFNQILDFAVNIIRSSIFASQGFSLHFAPHKRLWGTEWTENPWLSEDEEVQSYIIY